MAIEEHAAALETHLRFTVRLLAGDDEPLDFPGDPDDLLDAIDIALQWLDHVDPHRDLRIRLVIVERRGEAEQEVWRYPPEERDDDELTRLYGFNPVTWPANRRHFAAREQRIRFGDRVERARAAGVVPPAAREPLGKPPVPTAPRRSRVAVVRALLLTGFGRARRRIEAWRAGDVDCL